MPLFDQWGALTMVLGMRNTNPPKQWPRKTVQKKK